MSYISNPAVALTAPQILDTLIADARVAGSYGQRIKDAVGLDTFTAARITDITKISSAAVAAGDTANSIAQKVRGMADNQAVAQTSITVSDKSSRTSSAENITVTITPAAASFNGYTLINESSPATITAVRFSGDAGVTFSGNIANLATGTWLSASGEIAGVFAGANSRIRYITAATVGTYIVLILGAGLA